MGAEKHEVSLRLRAIELLAYWEGRLVTNRLADHRWDKQAAGIC